MKALLIGGTGTISRGVARQLLADGWEVTLLNRGSQPPPEGAEALRADTNDEAAVAAALGSRRFDVAAQFVGFTAQQAERDVRLYSGRVGQYIFISSVTVYQTPPGRLPITESMPLDNPHWLYARNKIACEAALLAHYRASGFPVTIVRPAHTYDERSLPLGVHGNGGSWPVVRRIIEGRPVPIQGDGTSLWCFTHSRDFARGFAGLMANPHAIGEAVHITTDEVVTWNAAYRSIESACGGQLRPVYAPSTLLGAAGAAYGYDLAGSLLGDKALSTVYDNTKLKHLVPGFFAATRFDQGVRECMEYARANNKLCAEDPDFDAFCDKLAEAMQQAEKAVASR